MFAAFDDYFQCILKEAHGNFCQGNGQSQKALHCHANAGFVNLMRSTLLDVTRRMIDGGAVSHQRGTEHGKYVRGQVTAV